jgi:hypothetical protein
MDPQTKHEIKALALSTLAAIPVAASMDLWSLAASWLGDEVTGN